MTGFFIGLFIGGTLGVFAMAILGAGARREDFHQAQVQGMRAAIDVFRDQWPHRVESYFDGDTLVRHFYDEQDVIHHTDKRPA